MSKKEQHQQESSIPASIAKETSISPKLALQQTAPSDPPKKNTKAGQSADKTAKAAISATLCCDQSKAALPSEECHSKCTARRKMNTCGVPSKMVTNSNEFRNQLRKSGGILPVALEHRDEPTIYEEFDKSGKELRLEGVCKETTELLKLIEELTETLGDIERRVTRLLPEAKDVHATSFGVVDKIEKALHCLNEATFSTTKQLHSLIALSKVSSIEETSIAGGTEQRQFDESFNQLQKQKNIKEQEQLQEQLQEQTQEQIGKQIQEQIEEQIEEQKKQDELQRSQELQIQQIRQEQQECEQLSHQFQSNDEVQLQQDLDNCLADAPIIEQEDIISSEQQKSNLQREFERQQQQQQQQGQEQTCLHIPKDACIPPKCSFNKRRSKNSKKKLACTNRRPSSSSSLSPYPQQCQQQYLQPQYNYPPMFPPPCYGEGFAPAQFTTFCNRERAKPFLSQPPQPMPQYQPSQMSTICCGRPCVPSPAPPFLPFGRNFYQTYNGYW